MSQLKTLFEPIKIGPLELQNRIKMPAITLGYGVDAGVPQRLKDFYVERAKGGVALIGIAASATKLSRYPLVGIYDDEFIPGLRELTEACHAEGAKVYAQLGVGYYWCFGDRVELVTPSGLTASGRPHTPFLLGGPSGTLLPRELTIPEIHQMADSFGEAARRVRQSGFDAVEFIASVGYILSQFLSPLTNKRTDEYGGSLKNRMRFIIDVIESARRKAGEDYVFTCRLSGTDSMGGYSLEDTKVMATMLEKAGISCFDMMAGWHESPVPSIQMSVPAGNWVYLAEEIKKVVTVPVAAGIRIHDPLLAEQVLAQGRADLISMARPLIADPELPNKAREGRLEDIRPCTSCCGCLDKIDKVPVTCTVNARAGRERDYWIEPTARPKRVVVIGGGPAGMEAAAVAAQRGHQVILYEKADRLGGALRWAAVPPHKSEIDRLASYLARQMEKHGVQVRLGEEATARLLQEREPQAVVVATGANPLIPDIAVVDRGHVVTALDVLSGRSDVGQEVIVVGGGMVGLETAEFLAQKGKRVIVVEMLGRMGNDMEQINRWVILQRLRVAEIRMETNLKVEKITGDGIVGVRDGSPVHVNGDNVVLAVGMKAERGLAKELEGKVELHLVGDCREPRRIEQAIDEGFRAGLQT